MPDAKQPLSCRNCGSENISTERRPNGYHQCLHCGTRWQNSYRQSAPLPVTPLSAAELNALKEEYNKLKDELKKPKEPIVEALQKMKLEPGDDLIVKLRGFDMDEMASLQSLKNMLEDKYPANRVLVFYLPEGTEIDFQVIKKI